MALKAEEVGFDSIWVPDHLLFRMEEGPVEVWECSSILTALAATTSRVELGTVVLCTSFRSPALLAKMADTIDEISGGRLILGLGAGFHDPEYRAFGYPIDHRYGRFEEAIRIIHGLLRDLILSQPVNDKWISVLQHGMGGHSSIMGYGPERFSFRENKAIIGCEARLVQPIIDHFKDWLPRANTVYEETVERDAQRAEEAERKQLQQRLAEGRFQARPCNGWELLRLHQPYQSSPDQSDFPELVASWMARTIRRGPERVSIRPARDPRCARALTGQGVMTSSCSPAWSPHHGRRIIQ